MEDKDYLILKNKAQAFVKFISKNSAVLGVDGWQLSFSKGEYGSTHVIEQDNNIPYNYRDKYFVNENHCIKEGMDLYTHKPEVEDMSITWQNC